MPQGEPLYIVACGIGVLTLIKRLKLVYPDVTQPWYTNNPGTLGTFDNVESYFNSLKLNGLVGGYYPYPTKRIMIMNPNNIEAGGLFGQCSGFKVCMGAHYLGGYIRDH